MNRVQINYECHGLPQQVIILDESDLCCECNPPGSAPSHRAGLEPGILTREAGAIPRMLKATASSVSH